MKIRSEFFVKSKSIGKPWPAQGMFPPELSTVRGSERATGFASRYRQLGIEGVMLHSYRGMGGMFFNMHSPFCSPPLWAFRDVGGVC
jgi:hypothetical protein